MPNRFIYSSRAVKTQVGRTAPRCARGASLATGTRTTRRCLARKGIEDLCIARDTADSTDVSRATIFFREENREPVTKGDRLQYRVYRPETPSNFIGTSIDYTHRSLAINLWRDNSGNGRRIGCYIQTDQKAGDIHPIEELPHRIRAIV